MFDQSKHYRPFNTNDQSCRMMNLNLKLTRFEGTGVLTQITI